MLHFDHGGGLQRVVPSVPPRANVVIIRSRRSPPLLEPLDIAAMPFETLIAREWLCTNGVGGFACSTVPGLNSRKYHGLLVAAMSPPVRRMVLRSASTRRP